MGACQSKPEKASRVSTAPSNPHSPRSRSKSSLTRGLETLPSQTSVGSSEKGVYIGRRRPVSSNTDKNNPRFPFSRGKSRSKRHSDNSSHGSHSTHSRKDNRRSIHSNHELRKLWRHHDPRLVSPIDVSTAIDQRISYVINLLQPTELLFLQRRIRNVTREIKSSNGNNNTVQHAAEANGNNASNSILLPPVIKEKTKGLIFKEKLIDESVFRRIFQATDTLIRKSQSLEYRPWESKKIESHAQISNESNILSTEHDHNGYSNFPESIATNSPIKSPTSTQKASRTPTRTGTRSGLASKQQPQTSLSKNIDPLASAFLLLQALSEPRWALAKQAAEEDAKKQDKGSENKKLYPPTVIGGDVADVPGLALWSICFLLGISLHGTRQQKILFLFHILLPPAELQQLFSKHTFPTWILEESSDITISLSSIFYHLQTKKEHKISRVHTCDMLSVLFSGEFLPSSIATLSPPETESSPQHFNDTEMVLTQPEHTTFSKSSIENEQQDHKLTSKIRKKKQTIESMLLDVRQSSRLENFPYVPADKFWAEIRKIFNENEDNDISKNEASTKDWSFSEFSEWADVTLSDGVLNVIFFRLFGSGILLSPDLEKSLVQEKWLRWQRYEKNFWVKEDDTGGQSTRHRFMSEDTVGTLEIKNNNDTEVGSKRSLFSKLFNGQHENNVVVQQNNDNKNKNITNDDRKKVKRKTSVWGGIGGVDGKGGMGHGVMYVLEKGWWDRWVHYVGGHAGKCSLENNGKILPPQAISNELLVDHNSSSPSGTLGSYHAILPNLVRDEDYVLVPPGVWDIIYEIYGGGPPLPRMVLPPNTSKESFKKQEFESDEVGIEVALNQQANNDTSNWFELWTPLNFNNQSMDAHDVQDHLMSYTQLPQKIPKELQVALIPWVLHCHLCDPYQPYRRGETGPISIRVMCLPSQPLWRVFAEILERLPFNQSKALDSNGKGVGRLWKRVEASSGGENRSSLATSRYGPWTLLCKNRHAPFAKKHQHVSGLYATYEREWTEYSDNASVENAGLSDGSRLMFEHALASKNDSFTWPREAAAKAGLARRLAEEDSQFRRFLRGLDNNGNLIDPPVRLDGTIVDAMDFSGRWYQAEVVQTERYKASRGKVQSDEKDGDTEEEEEGESSISAGGAKDSKVVSGEIVRVQIDFSNCGDKMEWIAVSSDRLAVRGRCTVSNLENGTQSNSLKSSKTQPSNGTSVRKVTANGVSHEHSEGNGALCSFPGYGACGLVNLGNTCYANSALQCLGYMPLLRSYLLSGAYKMDLNKDNPLGTGGRLLEEFADLLKVLWNGKNSSKAPSKFKQQLGRSNSQFSGNDQQDAQELLVAILDSLHEDCNKVRQKPMVPSLEDDWVKKTPVPRVGREAWWRYLRRNKSLITNIAMGQVMNRVTCPTCGHSSLNFDPFGILSIPFPTTHEVIFRCRVLRCATKMNCAPTLVRRKYSKTENEGGNDLKEPSPPNNRLVCEQYVVSLSRLADIGDLKVRLQKLTGIGANKLKLCTTNLGKPSGDNPLNDPNMLHNYVQITPLPTKQGPCFHLTNQNQSTSVTEKPSVTDIFAYEATLCDRPNIEPDDHADDDNTATTEEENESVKGMTKSDLEDRPRHLDRKLRSYGDNLECILYDSDPTFISREMSRTLWPKTDDEFTLGLRVDAIDHRKHWFPGSVVGISEEPGSDRKSSSPMTHVKVHFDNFASKWDEKYTIEQFQRGQVRPLYSNAVPKIKPIEFVVYHRRANNSSNSLFGQPFFLECYNEWSTARAGAHILAQASRFLQECPKASTWKSNSHHIDDRQSGDNLNQKVIYQQVFEEAQGVIAEMIHVLVESDRRHVQSILGKSSAKETSSLVDSDDCSRRSLKIIGSGQLPSGSPMRKKVSMLLPRLPFEIKVADVDNLIGKDIEDDKSEVPFPFSLVRTMGNFITSRTAIILQWKDVSELYATMAGSKSQSGTFTSFTHSDCPVLYSQPSVVSHKQSASLLSSGSEKEVNSSEDKDDSEKPRTWSSSLGSGMNLGVCLNEFCKELHAEGWTCPECKKTREGRQKMTLWHLPDLLTFHIKRFNCSARWREKINTKVDFPLTGLDMREWCDPQSPALEGCKDSTVYDLIGVVNHYGRMNEGHYVAMCKATACGVDGSEVVAHTFPGVGTVVPDTEEETVQTGWRLGRNKEKDNVSNQSKVATAASKAVANSAEPLWLQFDDDMVDPIPPRNVVSEMAYVLFYRKRRLSPANVAKYSSLE